jgi:uncharacterized protein (DUF58 family)
MARKNFQLRVREQDEERKQEIYRLLDWYRAMHRLRSEFEALAEIVENAVGSEQSK